jgi:hypothetical protein
MWMPLLLLFAQAFASSAGNASHPVRSSNLLSVRPAIAKMAIALASLGQPVPEPGSCASQPEDARRLLGVLGVFSHTANLVVRRTIRETWLTPAHESLVTKFVMRSQGDDRVAQEASKHGDVVMLDAPAAMSKDVGPLWSSMLWLACAPRAWPGADMIGHAEDDTYLHLSGIVSHLRHTASIPRDSEGRARILWGTFEIFHWNENLHLPEKYWNRYEAETLFSEPCHRRTIEHLGPYFNHTVVGPFCFAKGPLYFLSSALAREVAAHRAVGREARAVIERGDDAPGGYVGTNAYEDAFVGYSVAQLADSGEPLHYVSTPSGAFMNSGAAAGLRLSAPAVAVHLYAKRPKFWKFIRLAHEWKLRNHCGRPQKLQRHRKNLVGVVCGGARWQAWNYEETAEASEPCSNQAVELGTVWDERHDNASCAHAALHAPKGVLPEGVSQGNGACGATENGGDCATDSQGAWPMAPSRHSLATCIAMCRCCERCRYISYSAQNEDCSWFAKCKMGRLTHPLTAGSSNLGNTYTTVEVQ